MTRYFEPITVAELRRKVEAATPLGDTAAFRDAIAADLKVQFDWENYSDSDSDADDFGPAGFLGYHALDTGLTYYGACAGGDWEHPVAFVVYWDGRKLRAYVPTAGNPWNTTTKRAYGNDAAADLKDAKGRWPLVFKGATGVEPGDFGFEPDLMLADVLARVLPCPGGPRKKPKAADLRGRVEALVYYGTGDEGHELFRQACHFAYKLAGLGMAVEAATVVGWAERMAAAAGPGDNPYGPEDAARGHWG